MMRDDELPKPNILHQKYDRDCGVCVFAALAGVSESDVLADLPQAHLGTVTVNGWREWLQRQGFGVLEQQGCPAAAGPCAHLVATDMYSESDAHWVYRDLDGDVHDPAPTAMFVPANDQRMKELSFYSMKILTLSISQ